MIRIENLSKEYILKSGRRKLALNEISLTIAGYGVTTVLGKSGSGKSTLLNILGGMDDFNSGGVKIDNVSIGGLTSEKLSAFRRDNIGFVFQDYRLLEGMSVKDNITLAADFMGQKCDPSQLLTRVGLSHDFLTRIVRTLSGGERQRVAIARALIKNPQIILADEPTGNLDSVNSVNIFKILMDIARDRQVIIITHDEENAKLYSNRIVDLADGEIVGDSIVGTSIDNMIDSKLINANIDSTSDGEIANASTNASEYVEYSGSTDKTVDNTSDNKRITNKHDKLGNSRLSGLKAIKLGYSFFRTRLTRSIFAVVAGALCFAMMLSLLSMATYDNNAPMYKYAAANPHAAVFMNDISEADATTYLGSTDRVVTLYEGRLPFPVFSKSIIDENGVYHDFSNAKYYADEADFSKIGFDFRWGRLPRSQKEMTISLSYAEMFVRFGFCNEKKVATGGWNDGYEYFTIKAYSVDELIGFFERGEKFIGEYSIVGIHNDYATEQKALPLYYENTEMPLAVTAFYHADEVALFKAKYQVYRTESAYRFTDNAMLKKFIYSDLNRGSSQATSAYDNAKSLSEEWAIGSAIATALFVLLTIILLPILISNIVSDKKREIAVMRTLGATKGDIIKIFAANCGIIMLAMVVLGLLLGGGILLLYNLTLVTSYSNGFFAVPILFWHVLVVMLGVLAIVAICCVSPIVGIIKKSPNAIMRESK